MNILLIGSGGREHALARALGESASCTSLWATPGNPGIFEYAQFAQVESSNFEQLAAWSLGHKIDLVVIGPDQALADGMTDALTAHGLCVFGPTKAASRVEWSKAYAKQLMQEANIPTARAKTFRQDECEDAKNYIKDCALPLVIKADGLALGKGVIVAESHDEAITALNDMFSGGFSEAGKTVVVEDFLKGEEASVFAICDGESFVCLAPAQDHKRALDGDLGKNTGGMGSYAPAPVVGPEVLQKVELQIIVPLLRHMKAMGNPFSGCLFVGLMIDQGNPSVVEFNARFGDPETQSVLSVFRGDFAKLCASAAQGRIDTSAIQSVAEGSACTVVLVSGGYPDAYKKGCRIEGLEEAAKLVRVYHAGTSLIDGALVTSGGRVLGLCGCAEDLEEAVQLAYKAATHVHFDGVYYRRDIAHRALGVSTIRGNG